MTMSPSLAALPVPGILDDDMAAAVVAGMMGFALVCAWLLRSYWAKQSEIAKARYAALQALAEREKLDTDELRELIGETRKQGEDRAAARTEPAPQSAWWWRLCVLAAWILMLCGILQFVVQLWHPLHRGYWQSGVMCCFIATSIFATPLMFRELRRQGVV